MPVESTATSGLKRLLSGHTHTVSPTLSTHGREWKRTRYGECVAFEMAIEKGVESISKTLNVGEAMTAMSRLCAMYHVGGGAYPNIEGLEKRRYALSALFCSCGGVVSVMDAMARHEDEKFQEGACELLWRVVKEVSVNNMASWVPCMQAVVVAMRRHVVCANLQLHACAMLVHVSADYETHAAMAHAGVVAVLVAGMVKHPMCVNIQHNAILVFGRLSSVMMPHFREFSLSSRGANVVQAAAVEMMRPAALGRHTDEITHSAVEAVVAAMTTHSRHIAVQQRGISMLNNMCLTDEGQSLLIAEGVVDCVAKVMCMQTGDWDLSSTLELLDDVSVGVTALGEKVHAVAGTVQGGACVLLSNCTRRQFIGTSMAVVAGETMRDLVLAVMLFYDDNVKVQEAGCATLSNLVNAKLLRSRLDTHSHTHTHTHNHIKSNTTTTTTIATRNVTQTNTAVSPERADVIKDYVLVARAGVCAMKYHPQHANIGKRVCMLFVNVIDAYRNADPDDVETLVCAIFKTDVVAAVVRVIRNDPTARQTLVVCVLVMRMCYFSRAMCDALCAEGLLDCLLSALRVYMADAVVACECVKSLCVLCERNASVNARLGNNKVIKLVARVMQKHTITASVQTVGVALLSHVSTTGHVQRVVWAEDAAKSPLIAAMGAHTGNADVQVCALRAMHLHMTYTLTKNNSVLVKNVVLMAMQKHLCDVEIQATACSVLRLW